MKSKRKHRSKILVYGKDLALHVDLPQPDEEWIHAMLLRWAEWCRERKQRGACESVEGRYVAPKANIYNPPEVRLLLISVEEVREVNGAMLELPQQTRDVLAARYFLKLPDNALCRRFALKQESFAQFMRGARLMLQSTLLRRRRGGIIEPHNSTPPSNDEAASPEGRAKQSAAEGASS